MCSPGISQVTYALSCYSIPRRTLQKHLRLTARAETPRTRRVALCSELRWHHDITACCLPGASLLSSASFKETFHPPQKTPRADKHIQESNTMQDRRTDGQKPMSSHAPVMNLLRKRSGKLSHSQKPQKLKQDTWG